MSNDLVIDFKPTKKQYQMFEAFEDTDTTELVYGGSAGSAKSYGICALLIMNALKYPKIRIGLARAELTTLKKTTVVSFLEVADDWGISHLFDYNSTGGIIKFKNGSEIVLCELRYLPSDPDYTRLGGLLFTFGVIDEVGEVGEKGYSIFKSRLGRWKNTQFGIKPICVSTCNPIKNWLYRDFYVKDRDGQLEEHKQFIQALPTDNPYLPQSYLDNLATLPYIERERLLYGNWEYNDSDDALMTYETIANVWENIAPTNEDDTMYITADIAFTSDKMVVMVWRGLTIIKIIVNPKDDKIEDYILELAREYKVGNNNIAYDSDGVGQFLKKRLSGAKPIVNNARALKDENYDNLKTQLYYKLAELVNSFDVKCAADLTYKEEMIEELQQVRYKPSNKEGKLAMVDKGVVKRHLGRSPDFSDAMAYRMLFEYKGSGDVQVFQLGKR